MQGVPPVDREFDDRHIDHPDQGQKGGGAGAALTVVEGVGQGDIAEIKQKQDQHRGQTRVPHPPGAPHRLAPQRPGNQRRRGEAGAKRRRRLGEDIGQRMTPNQERAAGAGQSDIDEQGHPRRRHMHIHDAHRLALLVIGRRGQQPKIQAGHQQARRRHRQPRRQDIGEGHETGRIGETMKHPLTLIRSRPDGAPPPPPTAPAPRWPPKPRPTASSAAASAH